jgi:hypothetical protein
MAHDKDQILACDFFTVETIWPHTIDVLSFIELGTRRVHFSGITTHPNEIRIIQQAKQLVWELQHMEHVANLAPLEKEKMEDLPMAGKIMNHVPKLMEERFPESNSLGPAGKIRELGKELSFCAHFTRGTATYLVNPNHQPKSI